MSSIIKGLVDEQGVEETKKLSAQEKFKRSMKRAGYDMDAGAKRLQDLLDKQKKEREELEKKEKEIKEGPAVDAYMAGKSPAIAHFADRLDNIKEDETLQFAAEVTPKVSPYAGIKDRKFRGAIGEGIKQMFENPNESPTDAGYQQGGWRKMNEQEVSEDLRKWFKEKWVRFGPDGKIRGACARGDDSEGKPKCLPQAKAHALGKKGRKYAAAKKRREDPNPERSGPAKNVATKKKSNEAMNPAQQAAIAINMKKHHKKPKQGMTENSLNEGIPKNATEKKLFELLQAWGFFISFKSMELKNHGVDQSATNELLDMFRTYTGPVINGMKWTEITKGDLWQNPKVIPHLLKYIYQAIPYVEARIKKFVRPEKQAQYLDYIDTYLKPAYKEVVSLYSNPSVKEQGVAEGYTGRETKDGTWRVFKDGKAVAVAGPFKSREEAAAWIKKQKQGVAEGFSDISGLLSASNLNKSFIITAELAEGGEKTFRVKAQNEKVAIEKFKKHHSMAKIINVAEEGIEEGSKYPRNPASYHLKKYPVPQDQLARPVKKEPKKPEKKPDEKLDELKCWSGYTRVKGVPAGAPGSCKKKTNEEHQQCPECGGAMYEASLMNEKKDACYYKVKSRYKVWPSAYASGALVKCRKKGAKNWGSKSKSNEGQIYSTGGGAGQAQRYYTPKDNLGETKSNILFGLKQVDEGLKSRLAGAALAAAMAAGGSQAQNVPTNLEPSNTIEKSVDYNVNRNEQTVEYKGKKYNIVRLSKDGPQPRIARFDAKLNIPMAELGYRGYGTLPTTLAGDSAYVYLP